MVSSRDDGFFLLCCVRHPNKPVPPNQMVALSEAYFQVFELRTDATAGSVAATAAAAAASAAATAATQAAVAAAEAAAEEEPSVPVVALACPS